MNNTYHNTPAAAYSITRPLPKYKQKCRGQTIMFMVLGFTALAFMLFFIVDLHRIIQRKDQTQNAGDAAALAAARWQGATINLVGELNLMHVLALANEDYTAAEAITNMQSRLCFTGPLTALLAAQIAAKNNQMYVDNDMTDLLREHASEIRATYGETFGGDEMRFPEPWPGAWQEYANMLDAVADIGIAAGPDNSDFFLDPSSGHLLLDKGFYEAIDGRNWCWFHFNAPGLLNSYSSYHSWPPIPDPDDDDYTNSEIFGIGLHPVDTQLQVLFSPEAITTFIEYANLGPITPAMLESNEVMNLIATWYGYTPSKWQAWSRIRSDGDDYFPIAGPVKPEYDYSGADVVVRVNAGVERTTPGADGGSRHDRIIWTAAAKPFGYLDAEGPRQRPDTAAAYVLPAFRNTRLIPVDSASNANASSADAAWVRHVKRHLPNYLRSGPQVESCRYCQALVLWEIAEFRTVGSEWLSLNSNLCRRPSPGGPRRGGGSRRGH